MNILKIQENYSLAPLTTFKIGGPAEYFAEIKNKEELKEAVAWAEDNNKEIFILGGGSNVLISDQGIKGLVLRISNQEVKVRGERIDCGAGVSLNRVLNLSQGNDLSGVEWAAGIPGATIGGAIRGNAGAFGSSMSDVAETVEAFNLLKNDFELFSNKDCLFNYRSSVFKANPTYIVWSATLRMKQESREKIDELVSKFLRYRSQNHPRLSNAGCIFKNLFFDELKKKNGALAKHVESEGLVKGGKIGAGWIIDFAGLKGKTVGGAKVSLEHANFIVNTGKASAQDVSELIKLIKKRVKELYQVELEEEVQKIGF